MPRVGIKQKLDEDKDDSPAISWRMENEERRIENGNDNAIMEMNIN